MSGLEDDTALIRDLVDFAGVSASKLAAKAGVAPSTINRPYGGTADTRLSQRTLEKLQAAFPKFPGWNRVGDRQFVFRGAPAADLGDTLAIPMLELGYGMGGTFLDDIDPGDVVKQFPREFIRMYTRAPAEMLCFSYGIGDSMEPTITDRDVLLIDLSRKTINMSEQIWVLSSNGIGMVKHVRIVGGKTVLASDNKHISDYEPGEDELQIIGRVVAVVKRI